MYVLLAAMSFIRWENAVSCCGITLPAQEAEETDDAHSFLIEQVEDESFVTVAHEMSKAHHISFLAWVTSNKLELLKLYPEQNAEGRFRLRGHGILYLYCNKHGLMKRNLNGAGMMRRPVLFQQS
ncbi:MAG: hypothetical protein ACLVAW_08520 [Eisenbergiella massiliensis]